MNTRLLGDDDLPRSIPIMQTYDDLRAHFPDEGNEHEVVVRAADVRSPELQSAVRELVAEGAGVRRVRGRRGAGRRGVGRRHGRSRSTSPTPARADGATARRGLDLLRDELVPATVGRVGAEAVVGGDTAFDRDFNGQLSERLPLVFAFVLLLTLGLLLLTFRSLVVALTAIGLNVLSVLASYGLLVLVFQHSWAEGLLGFESNGAIVAWLPLFLFVILFGLSMDYHVFVLSRIREGVDRGLTTEDAVSWGIRSSAGVVTSAAVVMMAVFAIFATLTTLDMKQLGVGLAAAVLIDATIVRGVLLPATMRVLGDRNWYLPRALRWLPTVAHEAPASPRRRRLRRLSRSQGAPSAYPRAARPPGRASAAARRLRRLDRGAHLPLGAQDRAGVEQRRDGLRPLRVEQRRERDERLRRRERVAERVVARARAARRARRASAGQRQRLRRRLLAQRRQQPREDDGVDPAAAEEAAPAAPPGAAGRRRRTRRRGPPAIRPSSAARSGCRASRAGGAAARSASRRPWMRTVSPGGGWRGRTSPCTAAPTWTRPWSTGTAPNEMISACRASSPVVSRSTTR